jgi:hypothetical protein
MYFWVINTVGSMMILLMIHVILTYLGTAVANIKNSDLEHSRILSQVPCAIP